MFPNSSVAGQFPNPALSGALPTVPIRYPQNMIKTLNNNHPIPTMASPFFVDNLLQHQKAAANFQSQFVNSQLQSYIQEQHHQFMMQQNQLRHQQALKYAADLQDGYINNNDQHRKNSMERLSSDFSPHHNSRGGTPNSEEASPRMDYDEDEENHPRKHDSKDRTNEIRELNELKEYHSPRTVNGRSSVTGDGRSAEYDDLDNKEENSHSADEEIYTEDSPSRSPIVNGISTTVKSELRLSPNSYDNPRYYGSGYQDRLDDKKDVQEDSRGNKEEFQDEIDVNANNDSDLDNRSERKILRTCCSNCGSFDCNPFYPSCKNYGGNTIGIRRQDLLERRISNDSLETGYTSPGRIEMNGEDRLRFGDKEGTLDGLKRTSLDIGHGVVQKPVLKFSVSAILGDQNSDGERSGPGAGAKVGHPQDGYGVHNSGVFPLPGFSLAPIAKPIASRPPTFPPHLHSLLAHCRQHPYLAVGGNPSGPVFMAGSGAGAPFPWAGGARGKPRRGMMRRAVFSDTQRRGLERRFQLQKYISKPDRKKLAEKLGLKDSQVKIWFQNRRMKWRNSKERELLASGGSREQTLPNKNNPHPDLSDAEADRRKLSPLSPPSPDQEGQSEGEKNQKSKYPNSFEGIYDENKSNPNDKTYSHYTPDMANLNGSRSYSLMAADDAMGEDYDSENGSGSDEEINVT